MALKKKWRVYGSWMKSECPECGEKSLFFYDKYDSICCVGCNVWLNEKCSDPNCPYCARRPENPLSALFSEEGPRYDAKEWLRSNYLHKKGGRIRHERRRKQSAQNRAEYPKWKIVK